MSTFYRIALKPLDTFFFGGETTFGEGEGANYYAKSNLFPQQTTLLGVLRHQLLLQNEAFPLPNDKANALIGGNSFDADERHTFGSIKQISPVFMRFMDKNYFVRSREFVSVADKEKQVSTPLTLEFVKGARQLNNIVAKSIPLLKRPNLKGESEAYNPKEFFTEELVQDDTVFKIEAIFKESEKIGITKYKNRSKKNVDNSLGFYKQLSYRLEKDWSFAFYAELDATTKLGNAILTMGGESRPFSMIVKKLEGNEVFDWQNFGKEYNDAATPQYQDFQKVILLSDTIVSSTIYKKCRFAITDLTTFRNIKTHIKDTKKWSDLSDSETDKPKIAAEKRYLLKRGSVLFVDKAIDLVADLATPQYQRIGYNYFTIL